MEKEVKLQAGGRITIPKSFLQKMRLEQGDTLILVLMKQPKGGYYLFLGKPEDLFFDTVFR